MLSRRGKHGGSTDGIGKVHPAFDTEGNLLQDPSQLLCRLSSCQGKGGERVSGTPASSMAASCRLKRQKAPNGPSLFCCPDRAFHRWGSPPDLVAKHNQFPLTKTAKKRYCYCLLDIPTISLGDKTMGGIFMALHIFAINLEASANTGWLSSSNDL